MNIEYIDSQSEDLEFKTSSVVITTPGAYRFPAGVGIVAKTKFMVFTDNGREETGKKAIDWALEVCERGAGEIILTSIDKEGTGTGFDIDFINEVSNKIDIQVIAHGGAGTKEDILDVFLETKASAVALSSIIHYSKLNKVKKGDRKKLIGNTEFLKNKIKFKNFKNCNVQNLKKFLKQNSINIIQQ